MNEADVPNNTKLGRYRITGPLGRGGMGVVYSGEDELLKRAVAIKVLSSSPARGSEALERFLLEARAAARLNHPNVVAVHDIGEHDGRAYIVMELAPCGSAQARLRSHGPLPWRDATRIVAEVCRGLAAAHAAGLIHRDIKPSNILFGADGMAKLADFGLAKAPTLVSRRLTQAGDVLGTPQFMSPEHCSDQPLDERTDLYSLGATYYALLVGRPPYDSTDVVKVLYAHCSAPVPDPSDAVPGLPAGCAVIVSRAMAKSRTARFRTAQEMAAALESLLADMVPDPPPPLADPLPTRDRVQVPELAVLPPRRHARFGRRRLVLSGLSVIGVLVACCLAGAFYWLSFTKPSPERSSPVAPRPGLGTPHETTFRPRDNPLWGHKGAVNGVSIAGGLIASAGDDGTARLWPIDGGKEVRILQHPVALNAIALSPDGKTLATGGRTNAIFLWNASTGEKTSEVPTASPVQSLAFSPSGKLLAAGTGYELLLFDFGPALQLCARLLPDRSMVSSVVFSADGTRLAACTYRRNVHRWDIATLAETHAGGFPEELWAVAASRDGGRIAFASRTGNLYLWRPDQEQPPVHVENTKTGIKTMAFLPGRNTLLFAGDWGGPLRLRDLEDGKTRQIASGVSKVINALRFAPDGKLLAGGCSDGSVRLWDVAPAEGPQN